MSQQVIYIGYFVNDTAELLRRIPVQLKGEAVQVHADHVTRTFRPSSGLADVRVGAQHIVIAYAQVVTDSVQAVLVRPKDPTLYLSDNKHPHITIAVCNGAQPHESNEMLARAETNGTLLALPVEIEIPVTEGYFDGQARHTTI